MNINEPINSIHDLLLAMRKGINPIYVTSKYYFSKIDPNKECGTLIFEIVQIAYSYGCKFIEVKES